MVLIRGTLNQVQKNVDKLSNEELQASKWLPYNLFRRYEEYASYNRIENFAENVDFPTVRFFQENKTEVFELDCDGKAFEMFESMRIYIERDGRPYNYLSSQGELHMRREEHLAVEEEEWRVDNQDKHQAKQLSVQQQIERIEKMADQRLAEIKKHMAELEICDKLTMRQFLMKFIIPVLTEGMIEVCKVGPIDPVDYLAEYIYKRSQEFR